MGHAKILPSSSTFPHHSSKRWRQQQQHPQNHNNEDEYDQEDDDGKGTKLLRAALDTAVYRVVAKRPTNATPLGFVKYERQHKSRQQQKSNNKKKEQQKQQQQQQQQSPEVITVPRPSYDVGGSVGRWDVYVVPPRC